MAGIDEVGRGALAGPVSVGVVALDRCDSWPLGLADSKELSARTRETLALTLATYGLARAVGHASPAEIDAVGITAALRLAANRALASISEQGITPDAILLDGKHNWLSEPPADLFSASAQSRVAPVAHAPVTMVIQGDTLCASIAGGSVLAKVERDAIMREAHLEYPEFGWEGNKGYGAAVHLDAISRLGITPHHRATWKLPLPA